MAVTKGQGNPSWTRDETILALALYFECEDSLPSILDERVKALSATLRSMPIHPVSNRKGSFRNPEGVVFKLQNIRQVATGIGLKNSSKVDREVWDQLGRDPQKTYNLANLIYSELSFINRKEEKLLDQDEPAFVEGQIVTRAHKLRERDKKIRQRVLADRKRLGSLQCEICDKVELKGFSISENIAESMFEVHHIIPLSVAKNGKTYVKDMALLCANCHKMLHRLIAEEKSWITISRAREFFK